MSKNLDLIIFDSVFRKNGIKMLAGVDEAGRGPLAGPVTAAAVIFSPDIEPLSIINDSKKMTEKQREKAYDWIIENALAWSVKSLGLNKIHELNILYAALEAMTRSVNSLDVLPDYVLIDGNKMPDKIKCGECIKGGDAKSFSIAAASILAKVSRDRIMKRWDEIYPDYGLESHKGYGTSAHLAAIEGKFPLPIHRRDFGPVRDFSFPEFPDRQILGRWGENWAIYHMILHGYQFLERHITLGNIGEIDAIFKKGELFVIVEVKTSGPRDNMDPVEWINKKKIHTLTLLSEAWFNKNRIKYFDVRIDVITVRCKDWFEPKIEHYENVLDQ